MDNSISLTGNMVRDPELRFIPSGAAVCHFAIAVNRRIKRGDEWETAVSYFEVRALRELGENIASSLHKGDRVMVDGRLEQRSWTTEADEKRSTIEVIADSVGAELKFATVTVSKVPKRSEPTGAPDSATGAPREYDPDVF